MLTGKSTGLYSQSTSQVKAVKIVSKVTKLIDRPTLPWARQVKGDKVFARAADVLVTSCQSSMINLADFSFQPRKYPCK